MSKLKRLARETVLYGIGSILPRMLNFLLVPLYTHNLFSTQQYGVLTKLMAYVAFLNVIFTFGMETAYFRFANKEGVDENSAFRITQTCVVFISAPLSLLLILCASPIALWFDIGNHPEFIVWLSLIMLTDALVAIPFAQLRLRKKAGLFATIKIVNIIILLALNWYFLKIIYDPSINIGFVCLANLIANTIYILFFIKPLLLWRPLYDAKISPVVFKYAYPVMFTGIAGMTNEMFSRTMLDAWLPENFYKNISAKAAGGIFGACYKFAVFMNLGIQAFRYAAEPFFFSNASDKKSPQLFATVNHFFVIACCIVLFLISINLDILQFIIGKDFRQGIDIVPILLLAYLFLGVYYNLSVWFKLTDRTYYGTLITIGGAIVTVVANYFLIPIAGYMGSSWAALLCYVYMTITCYWLGQRYFPIPYTVTKDISYIVGTITLVYLIRFVFPYISHSLLINCFLKICLFLGFIVIIYFMERSGVKKYSIKTKRH